MHYLHHPSTTPPDGHSLPISQIRERGSEKLLFQGHTAGDPKRTSWNPDPSEPHPSASSKTPLPPGLLEDIFSLNGVFIL